MIALLVVFPSALPAAEAVSVLGVTAPQSEGDLSLRLIGRPGERSFRVECEASRCFGPRGKVRQEGEGRGVPDVFAIAGARVGERPLRFEPLARLLQRLDPFPL